MSDEEESSEQDGDQTTSKTGETEEENYRNVMTMEAGQTGACIACYVSYCFLLYNRKAFMFLLPQIVAHNYYTTVEIGWITTAQTLAYMKGKTLAGPLSELYSPRYILSASMLMSGLLMLLYGDLSDSTAVVFVATLNGFFQSLAWPAIAKIVFSWTSMTHAGLYWAAMTSSIHLMGLIGPPMAMFISRKLGWELAMAIPAMLLMFLSPISYFFTWLPREAGFKYGEHTVAPAEDSEERVHWTDIISSDLAFLNISVVCLLAALKQALIEWGPEFLQTNHSFTGLQTDLFVSALEIGGLLGCIILGGFTDKLIRDGSFNDPPGPSVRVFTTALISIIIVLLLNMFLFSLSSNTSTNALRILGGVLGFTIIGSLHLMYVNAIEFAPDYLLGYVHTVFAAAASFGYLLGSRPLYNLAELFNSWFIVFFCIMFLAIISFLILTTNKDIPSTYHREGLMLKKYPKVAAEGDGSSSGESESGSTEEGEESGEEENE